MTLGNTYLDEIFMMIAGHRVAEHRAWDSRGGWGDALRIITLGIYSLFKIKVGVNNGLWLAETGQRAQYWPLIGRDLNTGLRRWRSWSQLMPNAINESISRIYLNCKQKLYHLSCYPVIIQSNQLVTTEMQTSSGHNLIINLSLYSIPDLTTRDSCQWHWHR